MHLGPENVTKATIRAEGSPHPVLVEAPEHHARLKSLLACMPPTATPCAAEPQVVAWKIDVTECCLVAGHQPPRHVQRRLKWWCGKSTPRSVASFLLSCMRFIVAGTVYSGTKQQSDFLWHAIPARGWLWSEPNSP